MQNRRYRLRIRGGLVDFAFLGWEIEVWVLRYEVLKVPELEMRIAPFWREGLCALLGRKSFVGTAKGPQPLGCGPSVSESGDQNL